MLSEIHIENLTLIEKAQLELQNDWISVTGESGAGKSVFLGALRLATGAKGSADLVRSGASAAKVEAIFDLSHRPELLALLEQKEIPSSEGELLVSREITAAGKSRVRLNGSLSTLADLQEIGTRLIQFHGQSEQVLLKDLKSHEILLDSFAEHTLLLSRYKESLAAFRKAEARIAQLEEEHRQAMAQKDFLEFQFQELDKAALKEGEDEELEQKVSAGSKAGALEQARRECEEILSESKPSLQGLLRQLKKKVESMSKDFPLMQESLPELEQVESLLENTSARLGNLTADLDLSPAELDRMNERLAFLQRLKRKYRVDLPGLIELRQERVREMSLISDFEGVLAEAQLDLRECEQKLAHCAAELSQARLSSAERLSSEVDTFLVNLGMPCDFEVEVEASNHYGPTGKDKVEFFVTPNKGEGRRPLRASLSGGELSRIMLALKSAMAGRDGVPTLIFDEVDTGISGETSHAIAQSLQGLAKFHQVINITHLHQVASKSKQQLLVQKVVDDQRTQTKVKSLDAQERVAEIARMMGASQSEHALAHARSILAGEAQ